MALIKVAVAALTCADAASRTSAPPPTPSGSTLPIQAPAPPAPCPAHAAAGQSTCRSRSGCRAACPAVVTGWHTTAVTGAGSARQPLLQLPRKQNVHQLALTRVAPSITGMCDMWHSVPAAADTHQLCQQDKLVLCHTACTTGDMVSSACAAIKPVTTYAEQLHPGTSSWPRWPVPDSPVSGRCPDRRPSSRRTPKMHSGRQAPTLTYAAHWL